MKKLLSNYKGFTLVELMVVVGIIGILATIAIPNFRKYQAKSKTTEAKIQLSSVYTTMESMLLEYDAYGSCLSSGGYNPSPDRTNRFYAIGYNAVGSGDGTVAGNGLASCTVSPALCTSSNCTGTHYFYSAGKVAGGVSTTKPLIIAAGSSTSQADQLGHVVTVTASTFTAGASGFIDPSSESKDQWSINFEKKLSHVKVGY